MTILNESAVVELNEHQQEAVEFLDGPCLVLAGAGSGKTRVVTRRIIYLLERGIHPSKIIGLTFTNKAAQEMQTRVLQQTDKKVIISTFHSLGLRILRESIQTLGFRNDFTIYDEEDSLRLLKNCMLELDIEIKKIEPKTMRHMISQKKNRLITAEKVMSDNFSPAQTLLPLVYEHYQMRLKECNAVDFDDLLFLPALLFKEHVDILKKYQQRWTYLLIDEYQDTNHAQYTMINALSALSKNLFVVGDPDQSIYSWRGANMNNILNFEIDYPGAKIIYLEKNYRSRCNILNAANALISQNEDRYEKNLWSDRGEGEPIRHYAAGDVTEETDFVARKVRYYHEEKGVPYRDMVIFYRTNFQSRPFEDTLISLGIPYVIVGGISYYQRREIKDTLAFLRMVASNSDFISFQRTINLPKRGIGETTIEKLRYGAAKNQLPIFTYCCQLIFQEMKDPDISLTTRQKKGLQEYLQLILDLREETKKGNLKDLVNAAISRSGYLDYLKSDPETFADRKENILELITKAREWEKQNQSFSLQGFLEELSLKSNLDEATSEKDRLNLMTVHNGKGLEFSLTFIVGLEDGLFPHINSMNSNHEIEEERRLFYVAMTRAKEWLYLTYCYERMVFGVTSWRDRSRFLNEIPSNFLERI